MSFTILVYGAYGFSGRLIVAELRDQLDAVDSSIRVVLSGRNAGSLRTMGNECQMNWRVFEVDDIKGANNALEDVDVVINAAGPFAWTAERLASAAINAGCNYLDINGEPDVYQGLESLDERAHHAGVGVICSAGFWAAASDILLESALERIAATNELSILEIGAVRIAMSRIVPFSRGSAATVWRSLRERVIVVRKGRTDGGSDALQLAFEPVGKLERLFDFRRPQEPTSDTRIASAASLVDTLVARRNVERHKLMVDTIESYVETSFLTRIAYQLGALASPIAAASQMRAAAFQAIAALDEGPSQMERDRGRHVILLEIEDIYRSRLINWRWETPNVYQFTAQLAVGAALQLCVNSFLGFLSPAQALSKTQLDFNAETGPLRGCRLDDRKGYNGRS